MCPWPYSFFQFIKPLWLSYIQVIYHKYLHSLVERLCWALKAPSNNEDSAGRPNPHWQTHPWMLYLSNTNNTKSLVHKKQVELVDKLWQKIMLVGDNRRPVSDKCEVIKSMYTCMNIGFVVAKLMNEGAVRSKFAHTFQWSTDQDVFPSSLRGTKGLTAHSANVEYLYVMVRSSPCWRLEFPNFWLLILPGARSQTSAKTHGWWHPLESVCTTKFSVFAFFNRIVVQRWLSDIIYLK